VNYNFYVANYKDDTDSSSLENVFENQKATPLNFTKHPFVFTLEDLSNLFGDEIRIKFYQLLNIYVQGENLPLIIHFGFVDRTESNYAASNYLNFLIEIKSRLSDKEISEPEENEYFDFISCGQLFRYDKF
jgi:hypothetical protein